MQPCVLAVLTYFSLSEATRAWKTTSWDTYSQKSNLVFNPEDMNVRNTSSTRHAKRTTRKQNVSQLKWSVAGFPQRRLGLEPRPGHVGFVVDKVALGQVFSEHFSFSCHSFHRLLHTQHHPSFGAGTIGQILVDVPSRLSLTPPQEAKKSSQLSLMGHDVA
jgi:hypothetical protein